MTPCEPRGVIDEKIDWAEFKLPELSALPRSFSRVCASSDDEVEVVSLEDVVEDEVDDVEDVDEEVLLVDEVDVDDEDGDESEELLLPLCPFNAEVSAE